METVVGIFRSCVVADHALELDVGEDKITVLRPGITDEQVELAVPTSDTESPGMGEAMGGAVGGALGAAGGATLGAAGASLFVPGVGPIFGAGALGGTFLSAGGALGGVCPGDGGARGLFGGVAPA